MVLILVVSASGMPNSGLGLSLPPPTQKEEVVADAKPRDLMEQPFALAVGAATAIGIIVGTVVFAVTTNPIWLAIGIVVGAMLGVVAWTVLRANRQ